MPNPRPQASQNNSLGIWNNISGVFNKAEELRERLIVAYDVLSRMGIAKNAQKCTKGANMTIGATISNAQSHTNCSLLSRILFG